MAPLIPSPDTVILITGINGYIGSNIGLLLLSQGYSVRGTSRSASAKDRLLAGPFAPYTSTYQHTLVPDITAPSAFDTAVHGVHAIIHTASPVDFSLTTLEAFTGPAIQGVLFILHSALQHAGPQLRSFVLTSSIAAAVDRWTHPFGTPYAYSESDWNVNSTLVASDPTTFSPPIAYGASKTQAERALWSFSSSSSATASPHFACSAILPGVVMGPPVLLPASPRGLNLTLQPIWALYSGEATAMPAQIGGAAWVDVRDVSALHAWCATHPDESGGQRYLCASGTAPPQAIADLLRVRFPERGVLVGEPGRGYVEGWGWVPETKGGQSADSAKARGVLGSGYRWKGFEEMVLDTVGVLEGRWPGRAGSFRRDGSGGGEGGGEGEGGNA
ncbi:uncharacterized protein HMPREF1541_04282 [Cyphellophora europaea CBS 101466]|uniref:NAD-dependent epimerase/dehydratase domain-containing protein n=1 Tax=Cyphellophora europaea (strain CBS 101466) TaxID=1220924 RepID=W2RU95_CYPE1|nr:uncharacterized protein HMPREF1541_04282 [Cyphellophora europaea CBS 101466]ETN40007.1 hypothetical protein HMPREF1541_04282 [Cyphellophora europaea CBS 101466]